MQTRMKLIIAAILSLTVGVCSASPLLYTNLYLKPTPGMAQGPKANFKIEVVHVTLSIQKNGDSGAFVSYEMVLNITNPSEFGARTQYVESAVSEDIRVVLPELVGEDADPEWVKEKFSNLTWTIVSADDFFTRYEEFSNYWEPHQSRLIMLNGTKCVNAEGWDLTIQALANESVSLFASVHNYIDDPEVDGNKLDTFSTATFTRQVRMQLTQQRYVYSTLMSGGQTFRPDEWNIDVFIEPVSSSCQTTTSPKP